MNPRLIMTLLSVFLAAVLAGACGGGASPSPSPVRAGHVTNIYTRIAFVNDIEAAAGGDVYAGGSVRTDASGSADFTLEQKIQNCRLLDGSKVDVLPSPDVLLNWVAGTTYCSTRANPGTTVGVTSTAVQIRLSDPLFGVTVLPDATVVKVLSGIVEVRSLVTGSNVVQFVGPGLQTRVPAGQDPAVPERLDVDQLGNRERSAVQELMAALPPPAFSRPAPGDSPALTRIFGQSTIGVAIDEENSGDDQTRGFLESFLSFQGTKWDVKPDARFVPVGVAVRELMAGQLDLVVSPDVVAGTGSIPFFEDRQGRKWSLLYDSKDPAFADAMRGFLRTALESGEYGRLYLSAFDTVPRYDSLTTLVGL